MGVDEELLHKRMKKIKAGDKLAKRAGLKNKKESNDEKKLVEIEKNSNKPKKDMDKVKSLGKKRRNTKNGKNFEDEQANRLNREDKIVETERGKKERKLLSNRKTKNEEITEPEIDKIGMLSDEMKDSFDKQKSSAELGEKKRSKLRQKKRKNEKTKNAKIEQVDELNNEVEAGSNQQNGKSKTREVKKKDNLLSLNAELLEKRKAEQEKIYEISSGDEDCSKGMSKWIVEYHQSRPGIEILQERVDDFIISHEERKEREARAAEGGWTVVVHHKGRKKTTDSESGIAVGSVAHAAVTDKMAKKKNKEVGLDFYRFQKREAQRNEIMMLQSKFEQDKKRIQQMRAARKFRPY